MTNEMHLLGESIQEVTLAAWPVVYGEDNKYDLDSRFVLSELRDWAEEFENWWMSHDEDWREDHDYLEEIWAFTEKKCKEFTEMYEDHD